MDEATTTRPQADRVIYTCPGCHRSAPADRCQLRNGDTFWLAQPCPCHDRPHVANPLGLPPHAWQFF
jgi:hypothetical protein